MKLSGFFLLPFIIFGVRADGFAKEIKEVESKTFALQSGGAVTVTGDDGYVTVQGWDREEVALTITKRVWHRDEERARELMNDINVDIRHREDHLSIREIRRDTRHFRFSDMYDSRYGDYEVDYDLKVPRNVELKIETDEGDVTIEEIQGQLRLNVDEGEVRLAKLQAIQAYINVDEGDLYWEASGSEVAELYITIDEGEVTLDGGHFSKLDVDTDEGDVFLNSLSVSNCDLNSDEGDIEAQVQFVSEGRCDMKTDEGDITLELPAATNAEIYARAYQGRVRSNFDRATQDRRGEGESLDMTLRDGLTKLKLISEDGSINIRKAND